MAKPLSNSIEWNLVSEHSCPVKSPGLPAKDSVTGEEAQTQKCRVQTGLSQWSLTLPVMEVVLSRFRWGVAKAQFVRLRVGNEVTDVVPDLDPFRKSHAEWRGESEDSRAGLPRLGLCQAWNAAPSGPQGMIWQFSRQKSHASCISEREGPNPVARGLRISDTWGQKRAQAEIPRDLMSKMPFQPGPAPPPSVAPMDFLDNRIIG